jgi:hypothetical protein
MGNSEAPLLHIVTRWSQLGAGGPTVLCPCLEGLAPEFAFTVGILPVHDANGLLLDELSKADGIHQPDFAALCLADPFRRLDDILDRVEATGIKGIVNLPSVVPFLRHGGNRIFEALHGTERRSIDHATSRGFDCLLVTAATTPGRPDEITLDRFAFPGDPRQGTPESSET